jgi:hypothetical protein
LLFDSGQAQRFSRDCREPSKVTPTQRAAMPEFDTTGQGCRLATSVGACRPGGVPTSSSTIRRNPRRPCPDSHRRWGPSSDHAPAAREPALRLDPRDDLVGHLWRRRIGTSCPFRRSPRRTKYMSSTRWRGRASSRAGRASRCVRRASHRRCSSRSAASPGLSCRTANNPRRQIFLGPTPRAVAPGSTPGLPSRSLRLYVGLPSNY